MSGEISKAVGKEILYMTEGPAFRFRYEVKNFYSATLGLVFYNPIHKKGKNNEQ